MRKILIIVFVLSLTCCNNKSAKDMAKFYYNEIFIPKNMLFDDGKQHFDNDLETNRIRFITWYDSTECSICKLDGLLNYYDFIAQSTGLELYFIFSPSKNDLTAFEDYSSNVVHYYPIYIDTANMFAKLNPCIPENKLMHSFLLDATNRVVLVGSPIQNQAMFDLYKKTIDEMLN